MKIFFTTFIFIAIISIYPEIISTYLTSDTSTSSTSSLIVKVNEKKKNKTSNVIKNAFQSIEVPEEFPKQSNQNKTKSTDTTNKSISNKSYKVNSSNISTPLNNGTDKQLPKYGNGEYKGSIADAYYGYVQIKAIVSGGKISDIIFLKYPNDNRNSAYISNQALPYLRQEVIQAQNGNVDVISGATYTSLAFIQSTKDALSKAIN